MKKLLIILTICCLTVTARAENVVLVSSASGHPQDEVTLNVSLANTDAAVAFQVEIPLGSQLTYVAGSVALNPDRVSDHQVSAAVVNGSLRIYAYSLSLTPFSGNEGALVSFTLKLKNEPGDYLVDVSQAKLSDASGNALPLTSSNGTMTILSPKLQINTTSINYGHVPIRGEYTQNAGVTNVGNEPLTITSITFSDAVFSCTSFTETTLQPGNNANFTLNFAPMVKGALTATATITSNSIAGNGVINLVADPFAVNEIHVGHVAGYCDSIVELPISMNNMEGIIGFQIEANLNDALEFVDFTLSSRKTDHVATGVVSGTTLRLMAYSTSGAAFTGDDGVIGTVRFRLHGLYGNYYLNPTKAVLADANGEDVLSAKYQGYVNIRSPRINGNSALNFGSTPVTETVTEEYVVRNNGNASMRIDQVVFDQEGFAVAETFPMVVNQSSNTVLHVSYSREQAGEFNALMKIYSNDPQNGLKNVALSGHRYEPNSIELTADPFSLDDGDVAVAFSMNNYSAIVALQANFNYPYQDYSVQASDFQLTERFASHSLYALPINDSTFRILVLSMQNAAVEGHDGTVINVTLHPIGTPSEEEYTITVTDVVLSDVASENLFTGEDALVTYTLTVTQATQLTSGWNWWSTYIEQNGTDGMQQLQEALGESGIQIKSQTEATQNWSGMWFGQLTAIENEKSYLVNTASGSSVSLVGVPANPEDHPITLQPNWNWIGYPVGTTQSVVAAIGGFVPQNNDIIKGQGVSSTFYTDYGWFPSMNLVPGQGYLYKSNATEDRTFLFAHGREEAPKADEYQSHWNNDIHAFAGNMTVIATIRENGAELYGGNYELGAFVGGENRGSVKLEYFEPLDRYYAVLTINAEEGERVTFGIVDREEGTENYDSGNTVVFADNAVAGTLDSPYVIEFGTRVETSTVNLYPNPVERNKAITLELPTEERVSEVVVTDMLGRKMRHRVECTRILGGISESGVYIIQVITEGGNVYHGRIIVK
ncbi:MAG: choice-of-anchor D domain-containing protein [Bacteroidales bacterium]|nr:choice-of-anchor D domain-containing protein [Bacteroidales bacterium]